MYEDLVAFIPYGIFIVKGVWVTMKYSVISVFFGLFIGSILAFCKVLELNFLRFIAHAYTSVFRGTPVLIQLSIVYFALPSLIGIKLNVFLAGIIAFSLNSGAYISEIIRAGIESVNPGQIEAAKALGISPILRMKDIILPQAFRYILPALVNELINLVKESALISVVGEMDLMRRAQVVSANTFDFFMPMLTAAATYYVLVLIISSFAMALERRLVL
ncbi:MAG TPA: amino acid ABC transporter permease [Candidatus Megaira endosymbiont of Nemacystus decipiens]|nr:amino acid ABC transporter permease [Candidatus Megaera endosymbiont of Nemacystus decipiens]